MDALTYAAVTAALLAGGIAGFCLGLIVMAAIVWTFSEPLRDDESEPFRYLEEV